MIEILSRIGAWCLVIIAGIFIVPPMLVLCACINYWREIFAVVVLAIAVGLIGLMFLSVLAHVWWG